MVAINVCDLSTLFPSPASLAGTLLANFCDMASPVADCEPGRIDGGAIVLDGPAASEPERLDALVSLLTTGVYARRLRRPVRVYQRGPRGGWRKLKRDS